jgi:hypothetical protein
MRPTRFLTGSTFTIHIFKGGETGAAANEIFTYDQNAAVLISWLNGYLKPSDFKGCARDLITEIVKDGRAGGKGCAG